MLPRSTNERMGRAARENSQGELRKYKDLSEDPRQSVNLKYLKDKTIQVDCDVIQQTEVQELLQLLVDALHFSLQ